MIKQLSLAAIGAVIALPMLAFLPTPVDAVALPTDTGDDLQESLSDSRVCSVSFWGDGVNTVIYARGLTEKTIEVPESSAIGLVLANRINEMCYTEHTPRVEA